MARSRALSSIFCSGKDEVARDVLNELDGADADMLQSFAMGSQNGFLMLGEERCVLTFISLVSKPPVTSLFAKFVAHPYLQPST